MTWFWWEFGGEVEPFETDIIKISTLFSNSDSFCSCFFFYLLCFNFHTIAVMSCCVPPTKGRIKGRSLLQSPSFFPRSPCTQQCGWFSYLWILHGKRPWPPSSPDPLLLPGQHSSHLILAILPQSLLLNAGVTGCHQLTWLVPPTWHCCSKGNRQRVGDRKQQQNLQPF